MSEYSSYYKYQKYVTYHTQNPLPNIPLAYSVDGNGTMPLVLKNQCDPNCGCTGGTHDYSQDYLTFIAYEDETFKFVGSSTANTVSYSLDNGNTWVSLADNTDTPTVTAGNKIIWKASGLTPTSTKGIGTFFSSGRFYILGNIMSLVSGDSFANATTIANNQFVDLFKETNNGNPTGALSAEHLILPATTLASSCYADMLSGCNSLTGTPTLPATTLAYGCYDGMFVGCTSLTTAPVLPATTLARNCYSSMFYGCTSLTTAPMLPATTLANGCYQLMFHSCTSLTTAPELPVTNLVDYCYSGMFAGCTSLNYIKCLATDISAENCTDDWVDGVSSSGTFVKNSSMNDWSSGMDGIPTGWSVINA